jgi:hypothetical protein
VRAFRTGPELGGARAGRALAKAGRAEGEAVFRGLLRRQPNNPELQVGAEAQRQLGQRPADDLFLHPPAPPGAPPSGEPTGGHRPRQVRPLA